MANIPTFRDLIRATNPGPRYGSEWSKVNIQGSPNPATPTPTPTVSPTTTRTASGTKAVTPTKTITTTPTTIRCKAQEVKEDKLFWSLLTNLDF